MKDFKKICIISIYDENIKTPPFKTIQIDEMEVLQPEKDYLGEIFADRLRDMCSFKGYQFKFYTICNKDGYDYNVVVY